MPTANFGSSIDEAPCVSVIIPNYNHADYVGDAIASVLSQTFDDYEIIVVNDGSTDDSSEVIAKFGDSVRLISQTNRGLSAARNTGIRAARGKYIALLDADDMYEPDYLDVLVAFLQLRQDLDAAYCGYRFVDQLNRPLYQTETRLVTRKRFFQTLLDGNFLVPEAMLVRRQCYQWTGLFNEALTACEDWDMWLRISRRGHVAGIDRVLTRHRVLPGSMSSDPLRMLKNRLEVLNNHVGPEHEAELGDNVLARRAYGRAYLRSAVEHLQHGAPECVERAYRCFRRAACLFPDLLTEVDTFYEIGVGSQPKGSRGDLSAIDIQGNADMVLQFLTHLERQEKVLHRRPHFQRQVRGTAYYTLGRIAFNGGYFTFARQQLFRALMLQTEPKRFLNCAALFIKSLLGARILSSLRWFRRAAPAFAPRGR